MVRTGRNWSNFAKKVSFREKNLRSTTTQVSSRPWDLAVFRPGERKKVKKKCKKVQKSGNFENSEKKDLNKRGKKWSDFAKKVSKKPCHIGDSSCSTGQWKVGSDVASPVW